MGVAPVECKCSVYDGRAYKILASVLFTDINSMRQFVTSTFFNLPLLPKYHWPNKTKKQPRAFK